MNNKTKVVFQEVSCLPSKQLCMIFHLTNVMLRSLTDFRLKTSSVFSSDLLNQLFINAFGPKIFQRGGCCIFWLLVGRCNLG